MHYFGIICRSGEYIKLKQIENHANLLSSEYWES